MNEEINFEKYGSCVPIEKPGNSVDEIQQPAFCFCMVLGTQRFAQQTFAEWYDHKWKYVSNSDLKDH